MNSVHDQVESMHLARVLRVFGLAVVLAFTFPAQSQTCSGGNGGGTDATGNLCSAPVASAEGDATRSPASLESVQKAERALPLARAVAVTGSPASNPARSPASSAAQMGVAAHRKQVFDERRARFNGSEHGRVATAP